MLIKKTIRLIDKEALYDIKASLSIFIKNDACVIKVVMNDNQNLEFISSDFFKTLSLFRDYIYSEKKLFPLCKGALKFIYPSRMSRQMSNGLMAYSLKLGKQADDKYLINIFDDIEESEIDNLSIVEDQLNWFKKWLKSL